MNKTALIVVDMIYDFTNKNGKVYYPKNEEIIDDLANFIEYARHNDCHIVFIEHTVKKEDYLKQKIKMRECCIEGTGGNITDIRLNCDRDNDIIIKKSKYSAFFNTDLEFILRQRKIENVLICGTKTNNCILATALDAYYRDYSTYVIKDLVGTSDDLTNDIYLRDLDRYVAKVKSTKELMQLFESGDL